MDEFEISSKYSYALFDLLKGRAAKKANHLLGIPSTFNQARHKAMTEPLLWTGHATLIDEVAEAGQKPDAVVLSVGGGGFAVQPSPWPLTILPLVNTTTS